jgi:hypothetical protein
LFNEFNHGISIIIERLTFDLIVITAVMVNENYSNKKIIAISGAGPSAVIRWKKQYLAEINGHGNPSFIR